MPLIDTHCHLTFEVLYKNLPNVCRRAHQADVTGMITVGTDAVDSRRALAVADHYDHVYATIGIHPHESAKVASSDLRHLRELRHNPNVVAWGEIGLDYYYDFANRKTQQNLFSEQLALAKRADLPVVIHCRQAVPDTIAVLDEQNYRDHKVVFHCFTGTLDQAEAILDHGWWISFTGMVTFRNSADLQTIAKHYPLDQLMLETDAPYLTPEPHRKVKPNEPALLVHTAEFLAKLKGITPAELETMTTRNAERFFGLTR